MNIIIENHKKIITYVVFLVSIFLITFHFTDNPKVWVDEGIYTNIAESVAFHGVFGLQTEPSHFYRFGASLTTNYPVIFSVATSIKVFGKGLWQARLPMIIYMFFLVVLFYFFVNKLYEARYGIYPAVTSVLMLISFAPFYGNGRSVQGEVTGLVFIVAGLLLLIYFEKGDFENKKYAVFSGLLLGLAASTKTLFLLLLLVSLPTVLFLYIEKLKNKKTSLIFLGGFITPIAIWFIVNFPTVQMVKEIIPTVLKQIGNNGASSMSGSSSTTIQTVANNLMRFFTEATPILFFALLISTTFVFAWQYFKQKNVFFTISEKLVFLMIVLNWFGYLLGTGWYRYFFPAHVMLYLLFPMVVVFFYDFFYSIFIKRAIILATILLIIFQFTHLIFFSDTSLVYSSTRNSDISRVISTIPVNKKILFYNTTDAIIFWPGLNYYQYVNIPGIFEAGEKDSILNNSYDYILVDDSVLLKSISASCYRQTDVGRYFLLEKIHSCNK